MITIKISLTYKVVLSNFLLVCLGVVHENPRMGSDGESEEASGASDDIVSPVKLRPKNRRLSEVSTPTL